MKNTTMRNNIWYSEKKAFTIIVAILMIAFLFVLTAGVFNLVLKEMNDNRGQEKYMQSYSAAEWAMELGLLNIKQNWYPHQESLDITSADESWILNFWTSFTKNKDTNIWYTTEIATWEYKWILKPGETDIIPLFSRWVYNDSPTSFNLTYESGSNSLRWNIIWQNSGKSGVWFSSFMDPSINTFLLANSESYLMVFNEDNTSELKYKLKSNSSKFFSKPIWTITASAVVWNYRQNIKTEIDNSEFLNMLKYSVYSN